MVKKVRQDTIDYTDEKMRKLEMRMNYGRWSTISQIKIRGEMEIEENRKEIEDGKEIADMFNNYFIEKIKKLKKKSIKSL